MCFTYSPAPLQMARAQVARTPLHSLVIPIGAQTSPWSSCGVFLPILSLPDGAQGWRLKEMKDLFLSSHYQPPLSLHISVQIPDEAQTPSSLLLNSSSRKSSLSFLCVCIPVSLSLLSSPDPYPAHIDFRNKFHGLPRL